MQNRPVDWSAAPSSAASSAEKTNLVPNELALKFRLACLLRDVAPITSCLQEDGGGNVFWGHGRSRGMLLGYNTDSDALSVVRVLPMTVGTVTGTASGAAGGYAATRAFDGSAATDWRADDYTAESWLQGALAAAKNVDSVKVAFTETASGSSGAQSHVRGIRIRPSEHEDTTKTCAAICEELVAEMVGHNYNRAYVFASTHLGFFFDNGQDDYIPIGSDDGDFLKEFITAATAESIEVYASLFYLVSPAACVANDWHLEYENGGNYNNYWMCPNKSGVTAWMTSMIAILTTDSDYSSLTGIDFAEPQFGFPWQKLCFCSECRAAFLVAEATATFGQITTTTPSRVTATGTTWETWRQGTMTTALTGHIKEVNDAGLNSQVTSFYGIDAEYGEQLALEWKAILEGLDTDAILDATDKPTEWGWQMTWQEKAASSKNYTSWSPETTEYCVRWALELNNGRATPIIHIGAYGTDDTPGSDFNYGYDHTLTAAELQEAFEAAMRGGAVHLEGYALHTYMNPADSLCATDIWDGWDDAIASNTYNSILCEVQWNNGGTWEPVGRQAWFRTRGSGTSHIAHFTRKSEDQFRILLTPPEDGDREVYVTEVEFRSHSIQSSDSDSSNIWGGIAYDNWVGAGSDKFWAVRYCDKSDISCTMNDTGNTVTSTEHGLQIHDQLYFDTSVGGVTADTRYYVTAVSDPDTFQFSTTKGGSAFNITADGSNTYTISQSYMHWISLTTGLNDNASSPWTIDNYAVHSVNDLCIVSVGNIHANRVCLLSQGDRGSRAIVQKYHHTLPGTLASTTSLYLGHRKTAYGGIAYQPSSFDGTAYLVIAVNTPHIGQRFYWCNPSTLVEVSHADSELNWMWGASLNWAGTDDGDFLFGEYGGFGAFLVRKVSKLTDGEAASDSDNVLTWSDSSLTLLLHPETMLKVSTTSQNTILRVCLYAWDNDGTYLAPAVVVYSVTADGVETELGSMTEENSWGNVKLLSLHQERVLPECQSIKLVVTKAAGSTYIGILEVAANMATDRGDVVVATARKLKDAGYGDWSLSELQAEASDSICEVVVAGRTNKEDIAETMVAGTKDYSFEPCFAVSLVSLGGEALDHLYDVDARMAEWPSKPPGVPEEWRQETGGSFRVNPTPDSGALGMIGTIEETPTVAGSGYVADEVLTVTTGGSKGTMKVTSIDGSGGVTGLKLFFKDRSTRGTGYTTGSGKATTSSGSGTGCTIEIASLSELEITGFSGITRPTSDSDTITAIPEHYILPTCVPLTFAKALRNRKDGDHNLELADKREAESARWVADMRSSLRLQAPAA